MILMSRRSHLHWHSTRRLNLNFPSLANCFPCPTELQQSYVHVVHCNNLGGCSDHDDFDHSFRVIVAMNVINIMMRIIIMIMRIVIMIMTTMMKMITSTSPSQGELFPAFDFHGRAPPL